MNTSNATTIFDPISNKFRNIKGLRVMSYKDIERVVEFTVIGNNNEWLMSLPVDVFMAANPGITI
jgi:hypothetical protein